MTETKECDIVSVYIGLEKDYRLYMLHENEKRKQKTTENLCVFSTKQQKMKKVFQHHLTNAVCITT